MNSYGSLISSMLSQASLESSTDADAEPNGAAENVQMSSNPDYKAQGAVMIEFDQSLQDSEDLKELQASLESSGWTVRSRVRGYSTEDTSDGQSTGRPVPQDKTDIVNSIVNGINEVVDEGDLYKVVQLVRPEDTIPGNASDIIYLMNDNGDVKDYLRNEGHLVASDADALNRMLLSDNEKDL